jgi:hypothetical protein
MKLTGFLFLHINSNYFHFIVIFLNSKSYKLIISMDKGQFAKKRVDNSISYDSLKNKSKEELIRIILSQNDIQIPATVFSSEIAPLTSLVKYLHDEKKMPVKEISSRLNRHEQTIWTIVRLGKKAKLLVKPTKIFIPLSVFSKEKLSALESLTSYLSEQGMKISEIALLLNKNLKTIWTCYSRYRNKEEIK